MKHLFIVNPKAGTGNKIDALLDEIHQYFASKDYEIKVTTYRREGSEIARKYAKKYDAITIYICGGDGSINEVVNGVYKYSHVHLAMIPMGTGNDFVKSLPCKTSTLKSIRNYVQSTKITCDVLQVDDIIGVNTVSIGFDVKVAQNVKLFRKFSSKGEIVPYYLSLLYSMMSKLTTPLNMQIDTQVRQGDYAFAVFCNGRYYGGGYYPAPNASLQDGEMDVVLIQNVKKHELLRLSKKYEKGTHIHLEGQVEMMKSKIVKIKSDDMVMINVDGEIFERKNPQVKIIKDAITIVLPHEID